MEMIEERNLSGLIQTLTFNHPIIQILKENTLNQLKILSLFTRATPCNGGNSILVTMVY